MSFLPTLLSVHPYLYNPDFIGWAGWLLLLGFEAILFINSRHLNRNWTNNRIWILVGLMLMVPLTSLYLGIQLDPGQALPFPNRPENPSPPVIMLFSAVPWILAGGFLGPWAATILAASSGILISLWGTHNIFTALEVVILANLFSIMVGQRYRTPFYRLIRKPLFCVLLLALLYPLIHLLSLVFSSTGILVNRIEFSLASLPVNSLIIGIELLIAGLFAEFFASNTIARRFPDLWRRPGPLLASPAERSLQTRFMIYLAPLAIILILAMMGFSWFIAGNAARTMFKSSMQAIAELAANNIPFFREIGQQQIFRIAQDPVLQQIAGSQPPSESQIRAALKSNIQLIPFFHQISLLDAQGEPVTGYPFQDFESTSPSTKERQGIQYALGRIPNQTYSVSPDYGSNRVERSTTAQISFISPILDHRGQVLGVLVGRTSLGTNPYTKPLVDNLQKFSEEMGQGILIDEEGLTLIHPDSDQLMTHYQAASFLENPGTLSAFFREGTGYDNTKRLFYYQPVEGSDWSIVLTTPVSQAQMLALRIAGPILAMILTLSIIATILLYFGVGRITNSLKDLSSEAARIAQGNLNEPLKFGGVDEVGDLRQNFERMRLNLKDRLDELNRLLVVSQGIVSSLDLDKSIQPVLDAALSTGATSARVVLAPAVIPELDDSPTVSICFGAGTQNEQLSYLDEQILALNQNQKQVILSNRNRLRVLHFGKNNTLDDPGVIQPEAILALSLRHEYLFYGTLWIAFTEPHKFTMEELGFMKTLASQAAFAAGNSHLFLTAEVGRQRLAAIINSSPDPILVTDKKNKLIIANPTAIQVFGLDIISRYGQPVGIAIPNPDLASLLGGTNGNQSDSSTETTEISLPNGQVFMATASSIYNEGEINGRVCILRDVTRFKQLDTMKSEFVSTVSHDLRHPLTMMRGYATMLEMVGQLNDQQQNYLRRILTGVENMSRLVSNLLDLGRIESGVTLQFSTFQINTLIDQVLNTHQLQAVQKRILLTAELSEDLPPLIEADASLLEQAINNLVENALKFTRPEGKVQIRVNTRHDQLQIQVMDNGIGVSPLDKPRLFEKFYRGAQSTSKDSRGTGLGLAIVKSIVEQHSGQVWVESQLGKGSTFTILIPIRHEITIEKQQSAGLDVP